MDSRGKVRNMKLKMLSEVEARKLNNIIEWLNDNDGVVKL